MGLIPSRRQLRAIRFGILQLPIYNSVVASIQLLQNSKTTNATFLSISLKRKMLAHHGGPVNFRIII